MKKDKEIDGYIGMDLPFCDGCGLESEDCKCDAILVDELADDEGENERLKADHRARS